MRIISSIVAAIVLVSLLLAFQIWREVDPGIHSRQEMVRALLLLLILSGPFAAFTAIVVALNRKPYAVGFGVYAILHGSGWLYLTWRWGFRPGSLEIVAGLTICIGLRAVMMLRKRHDNAPPH